MNKFTRLTRAALVATIALVMAACASHPVSDSDGGMLQRLDAAMRSASVDMPLQVRLEKDQVRTGEAISMGVASPKGGYLYVFQLGTEGKRLSLIFPNAMDGANYLAPNSVMSLPRAQQWQMNTSGPAGVGYVLAVLAPKPLDLMALQANVRQGQLDLPPGYGAALVPWREVAP